jgi:hypothetical protein
MKVQLLGDSKDSFKWDYNDWLASELKVPCLTVAAQTVCAEPVSKSSETQSRRAE